MNQSDKTVYNILLKKGLVSKEDLDQAAAGLTEASGRLEAVLFKQGVLNSQQLVEIVRLRDERMNSAVKSQVIRPTQEDRNLGKEIVNQGIASVEQVRQCMRLALQRRREGQDVLLAEILVQQRLLSASKVADVESAVRGGLCPCTECGEDFIPNVSIAGQEPRCPRCTTLASPGGKKPGAAIRKSVAVAVASHTLLEDDNEESVEGRAFGPYRITEEIARGAMGIIYRGFHTKLEREVALKVIKNVDEATEEDLERFRREAEAVARLSHPNIIPVYEVGEEEGIPFLAMEYIQGAPLDELILADAIEYRDVLELMVDVAGAVAYAHRNKVIHRDLKPGNILIDLEGRPRLTDFGLAKTTDTESRLTQTGTAMGTPYYMAPEQFEGAKNVDKRADIYSLGVILYELLTGNVPYVGETPVEVYTKIITGPPPTPREYNPAIHRHVEKICLKALAHDPKDRYPTAQALADDIERYLMGESVEARAPSIAIRTGRAIKKNKAVSTVSAVLVVVVLLVGWFGLGFFETHRLETAKRLASEASNALIAKEYDRANAKAEEAIALVSDIALAWEVRVNVQIRRKKWTDALDVLGSMMDALGEAPEHFKVRASIYEQKGDIDSALADMDRYLSANTRDADAHYARGIMCRTAKRVGEAMVSFRNALAQNSGHRPSLLALATIYIETDGFSEALPFLENAVKSDPTDMGALRLRAQAYAGLKKHQRALDDWRVLQRRAPSDVDIRIGVGNALWELGHHDEAFKEYNKLGRAIGKHVHVLYRLGMHLLDKGVRGAAAEAGKVFKHATIMAPNDPRGYLGLTRLATLTSRWKHAEENLQIAKSKGASGIDLYVIEGMLHIRRDRYDKALEVFEKALVIEPENWDCRVMRGISLIKKYDHHPVQSDLDRAIEDLIQSADLSVKFQSYAHSFLGFAFSFDQSPSFNPDLAVEHTEKALKSDRGNPIYLINAAIAQEAAENPCQSVNYMNIALRNMAGEPRLYNKAEVKKYQGLKNRFVKACNE